MFVLGSRTFLSNEMSLLLPQVHLRLILVSGKTQDFTFSPNDSATDIAKHVFENWPAGKLFFLKVKVIFSCQLCHKHHHSLCICHIHLAVCDGEIGMLLMLTAKVQLDDQCLLSEKNRKAKQEKLRCWKCVNWLLLFKFCLFMILK